jgi:hypothetical protein
MGAVRTTGQWTDMLANFQEVEDAIPLHYYTHLMHGGQVLAYKHCNPIVRERWEMFYAQCCEYLHVPLETERQMDKRLNDFGSFGGGR